MKKDLKELLKILAQGVGIFLVAAFFVAALIAVLVMGDAAGLPM